jgi:parallel beta-helix repeat protein
LSCYKVRFVNAVGTIYIRSDGSIDPPTASITTTDNATYIFTGNINDSIIVERDSIVVDGAGYTLQGTGASESKGIDLTSRSNVTIKNTTITAFYYGIYISSSSNNSLNGNNTTNSELGICLYFSSNNSVSENNVTANNWVGIWLYEASNNEFYHNNFISNTQQVYDVSWDNPVYSPSMNAWDDGYPSGGNYWSDYNGVDLYSGPYQNVTGSDGVGDTPYIIDSNNQDHIRSCLLQFML